MNQEDYSYKNHQNHASKFIPRSPKSTFKRRLFLETTEISN